MDTNMLDGKELSTISPQNTPEQSEINQAAQSDYRLEIFEAAKNGDSDQLDKLIRTKVDDIRTLMEKHQDHTILHHACNIKNKEEAEACVRIILNCLRSYGYEGDELFKFVNERTKMNQATAISIAVMRRHDSAIELLLKHNATVDTTTMTKISKHHYHSLLNIFDNGIKLHFDKDDCHNEALWTLKCDFGVLTGSKLSDEKECELYRESLQLATILKYENYSKIIVHPLPQLFLQKKRELFDSIIICSVVFHIFWAVFSAAFIMCNASDFTLHKIVDVQPNFENETVQNMNDTTSYDLCGIFLSNRNETSVVKIILIVFWLVALAKEIVEIRLSFKLSKRFYIKQLENWGQGLVVFCAMPIGLFSLPDWMTGFMSDWMNECLSYASFIAYLVGGFSSMFLVQSQFSKIKKLGVLIEIIMEGFWKILLVLFAFVPMLLGFLLVFHILMPNYTQYQIKYGFGFVKVLAAMTGELNYDEAFSEDKTSEMEYDIIILMILAQIAFACFIVCVVLLFQNILIGLTISDIEILKTKATAEHLAVTLEVLYLLEAVLMSNLVLWCLQLFKKRDDYVRRYTLYPDVAIKSITSKEKPKETQTSDWTWYSSIINFWCFNNSTNEQNECLPNTAQCNEGGSLPERQIHAIENSEERQDCTLTMPQTERSNSNDKVIFTIKFVDLSSEIQNAVRARRGIVQITSQHNNMELQNAGRDSFNHQTIKSWNLIFSENIEHMKKIHCEQMKELRELQDACKLCASNLCSYCRSQKRLQSKSAI